MLHHLHCQPSELDLMPYYEYHWLIEDLQEILEQEKEAQTGEHDKSGKKDNKKQKLTPEQMAQRSMQQTYKQAQTNMQNMTSNFKMPSLSGMPGAFGNFFKQ